MPADLVRKRHHTRGAIHGETVKCRRERESPAQTLHICAQRRQDHGAAEQLGSVARRLYAPHCAPPRRLLFRRRESVISASPSTLRLN